jgi:hypothetical protein
MQFRVLQKPLYKINDRFYDNELKMDFTIVGFFYDFIAKGFYYIAVIGKPVEGEYPQQLKILEYPLRAALKNRRIRKVDIIS